MPDMLVKLYTLPDAGPFVAEQRAAGVDIRRALVPEKYIVVDWVRKTFGLGWAAECETTFARQPVSCFIAVENNQVLGFSCYDATYKNFFGPIGVNPALQGRKIGAALLVTTLQAQAAEGYAYAIIGGVGPAEFYTKTVGAELIPDSVPGIYRGLLHKQSND